MLLCLIENRLVSSTAMKYKIISNNVKLEKTEFMNNKFSNLFFCENVYTNLALFNIFLLRDNVKQKRFLMSSKFVG